MAGPKQTLLCMLLMLLMVIAVGCGNDNLAAEDLKQPLTAGSSKEDLPSWLLLEHRSETLSDEDLGFVVIESEYRIALEEEKYASSTTVKTSSAGSSSGSSDDKWKGSVTASQQSSNSGSWWEQPSSNNNNGQLVHSVQYNLED